MAAEPGLVVVGDGPAGAAAATAYREMNPQAVVTVFCGEGLSYYSRPRLPEVVAGKVEPLAIRLHADAWYEERRIGICLNRSVTRLDIQARTVTDGSGHSLEYGSLILAMGAEAMQPPIPGLPAPGVFVLRTVEDAGAIHRQALGKRTAAVIGGGLLGLEAGFALTQLGLSVAVVESAPWLLPRQVDAEGAALLQRRLQTLGFSFHLGEQAAGVEAGKDGQVTLLLTAGARLAADLAVISAGIAPRIALAREAGIAVRRGILVNDAMETGVRDVYAAGDAAEWQGRIEGLWPAAQGMGRVAGINAAGGRAVYPGQVPSTTLKVAGVDLCSQGDINPAGARVTVRRDPLDQYSFKLFFRNDRLAGSIQIGRLAHAQQYKLLMDRGLSVAGFENELLRDDFDFKRIPGF